MCGIAGEVCYEAGSVSSEWARLTCTIMAHRGPDGHDVYVDTNAALAHRRLSIIDLSGGAQPMSYRDGRYWITFNGEIYNYRALRSELDALGCTFETKSDTEVILAAYAAWGVDAVRRLDGIFAFGIWDKDTRTLVVARDHLGIKPILYHMDAHGLRFASELKALLAHPEVKREINNEALHDYLTMGYVLNPKTIIRDIHKLPPAHYLIAQDGKVSVERYWDLADFAESGDANPLPDQDYVDQFDALLKKTVADQMVSDVPLGAFLSGGLDSSTISYYAAAQATDRFKTFSIGFEEEGFSEASYARQVADHLHSSHNEQTVKPLTMDELSKLIWYYDEPLGDTSIIPTYFVSKLARQQVTVSLSGDGGDELLAGYDTYLADRFQRAYAHVPGWLHRGVVAPAARLIPSRYGKLSLDYKIKQFVAYAHGSSEAAHYGWRTMFDENSTRSLMGGRLNGYLPLDSYLRYYDDVPTASPLRRAQYVDIKTWLADDILQKVDRASMASSLEARVPFLSPRVVEFAMTLPDHLKLRGLTRKVILKNIMKKPLPASIVNRKKAGFTAPISLWMRGALKADLDHLFKTGASQLVDLRSPDFTRMWQEHSSGQHDHGYKLWTLLSLALWEQQVYAAVPSI